MTVELLFDGFEHNISVAPQVDLLETLARPVEASSNEKAELRPHFCIAIWGDAGIPRLCCVIESVQTKYTMLSPLGKPLRAICTVKLKEADVLSNAAQRRRDEKLADEDRKEWEARDKNRR